MKELTQLIADTLDGDLDAFGQIVRRFQDMSYGYAYSILGDFHLAQDVTQEAFIEAYETLGKLREPLAFSGWLRRIVLSRCHRILRRKRLPMDGPQAAAWTPTDDASPDRALQARETGDRILDAVRSLPRLQRETTTLYYMDGYSQAEIAEFLEVPTTTVKSRLHAARKRLKETMMKEVAKTLRDNSLPEDFRVVVGRPGKTRTTAPALAWFRDRWILIWQNGERGKRWDGPYWFMLSESKDGTHWSEPRRLDMPEQVQCLPKLCVWRDEVFMLTHCYHRGLRLARSSDLVSWDATQVIRMGTIGRSNIFPSEDRLYLVVPVWGDSSGDSIELLSSSDGTSWRWHTPPYPNRGTDNTDAAGVVHDGRIYVVWRDFETNIDEGDRRIGLRWSEDDGLSWSEDVWVDSLLVPKQPGKQSAHALVMVRGPDESLVIAQEVVRVGEDGWVRTGRVQLAVSRDRGQTWSEAFDYDTGKFWNPAVGFTEDGTLILAGSSGGKDGTTPWIAHSRLTALA